MEFGAERYPCPLPTPPQQEVLAYGLLTSGFDCVLQMPTGAGKTWLAEQAMAGVLAAGRRAVYLTPLRALAAELSRRWRTRFAPYPVGVFTGDSGTGASNYPIPFLTARLLVMTPERLDACTRSWRSHWGWIPEIDLVVVDEFHLLSDRRRGPRLEGTLGRIRRLNPFVRLLCLSATLGNRSELADWLGAVDYASCWRPVPLDWRVVRYRKPADKPDLLCGVVQENIQTGGKSLVFVQSRRRAEELDRLLQAAGLRVAHHHAGLGAVERGDVESRFRGGELDALTATATLEMGLNLPVRQVVLYDLQAFDGQEFVPLSCASVWQRAGRAGRPGLDAQGEVVLFAAAWDRQAGAYEDGLFEPIRSGLRDRRALAEQILVEVASGMARTAPQLRRAIAGSLAAHQGQLANIDHLLTDMVAAGMLQHVVRPEVEEDRPRFQATRLGRIACRHFLAPDTVRLFRSVLDAEADPWIFDLLLLAACSQDCAPLLPVDYEDLTPLAELLARECSRLLAVGRDRLASLLGANGKRLLSALKIALAARDWTRSGDAARTADKFHCYPFEVERLCESLDRLLSALLALCAARDDDQVAGRPDDEVALRERVRVLQRMMAGGLDEEAATLTLVPGIGSTMARRLRSAGIEDVEALAQADVQDLKGIKGLSAERAGRWIAQALALVPSCSALRYRETGPAAAVTVTAWPAAIDPYRLRRSLELTVTRDQGAYRVTGGLDPHRVQWDRGTWSCDCPDAEQGHLCKHVLAVRLAQGDHEQAKLVRRLSGRRQPGPPGPVRFVVPVERAPGRSR